MTIFNADRYTEFDALCTLLEDLADPNWNGKDGEPNPPASEGDEVFVEYNYLPGEEEIPQSWGQPGRPGSPAIFEINKITFEGQYYDISNANVEHILHQLRDKHGEPQPE